MVRGASFTAHLRRERCTRECYDSSCWGGIGRTTFRTATGNGRWGQAALRVAEGSGSTCAIGRGQSGVVFSRASFDSDFCFLLPAGARVARLERHRLRHLRHRQSANHALRRTRELLETPAHAGVLAGAQEYVLLRPRRRAAHDRGRTRRSTTPQREARSVQELLPHDLLHSIRDDAGRRRDRVALPLPHSLRPPQLRPRSHRHRTNRLARESTLGNAGDHSVSDMEAVRIQHADLHRRTAGDPSGLI